MSASLSGLIPELRPYAEELDRAVHASGLRGSFTSTIRTHAEQQRLYDRYLRGEAQFPAAPPGLSAHEYGYAFDYVVSPYEYQDDAGSYWQDLGGVWSRKDRVHFEYPGFTPPAQDENIVQQLADKVNDIPWYLQLFTPIATATKTVDATETQRIRSRACELFGIGCGG